MFSKNLKYYRLKSDLTKAELASRIGVTPMAISNYESGKRRPDMQTIKTLASTLGILPADFLSKRNGDLVFHHGEFRKCRELSKTQQDFIRECVEAHFNRFFEIIEILGGEVLPAFPTTRCIAASGNKSADAAQLRAHLGFAAVGPIGNLIRATERIGVLVTLIDIQNPFFSGINGTINDRPYIAINRNMTSENMRLTLAHELVHVFFVHSNELDEKAVNTTAKAFLIPDKDLINEIGYGRKSIFPDFIHTSMEYGISLDTLVHRALECNLITESVCKDRFRHKGKVEQSMIESEVPSLFQNLVLRALYENEISISKGAELLSISHDDMARLCGKLEG